MSEPAYILRSAVRPPAIVEADPLVGLEPAEAEGPEYDPFYYGWRQSWEKTVDGEEKPRWIPLTYDDLLDPQEDDVVAEDTIHRKVTDGIAGILESRYQADTTVAVWSNLKIVFHIPGLTTGPGPDICVVAGVEDRDRWRRSFRYGQEPGKVRLVIEVVSKSSVKKDYRDLLAIYAPLGVEEYVAIHPLGSYSDGPFKLTGWRLDPHTRQLLPIRPGPQGRIHSRITNLLFGTGKGGWRLKVWDAATGERLRPPKEAAALQVEQAEERAGQEAAARRAAEEEKQRAEEEKQRAEEAKQQAEQLAGQEAAARRAAEEAKQRAEEEKQQAEQLAGQEAAARRAAEEEKQRAERRNRELAAKIERLRARNEQREEADDT